ncbi:MAG: glycosyltransferase family 4 protein [Cyanobacteria bacterium P01_F01_bin.53]
MKVLFVTPVLEHPAAGGPQLRIENSIKALNRISQLDIISNSQTFIGPQKEITKEFFYRHCEEFHVVPRLEKINAHNKFIRKGQTILRWFGQSDHVLDSDFILRHVERRDIDVVWFGYGNISFPLMERVKGLRPELKIVCDTDSVWSRFVMRELPYAEGTRKEEILQAGRAKEKEEKAWIEMCEVTTAVSAVDMEYYQSIASEPQSVHLFSNVIDPSAYGEALPAPDGFKKPSIYLAGSFSSQHSAMNVAAQWMLDEVFPLVLKEFPQTHFYIVGRASDKAFGHLESENITVTGRVESVLPYLCNTDVVLVPLKFESGTRFKILEAGACEKPIVSTTLGAEGIPVTDGKDILLADESEDFAQAIVRVLSDASLSESLARQCGELIAANFSIDSAATEAKRILAYLAETEPRIVVDALTVVA